MNESEARIFIAAEVSKLLWQRLALIASLFGIANIVALVALWASITSQAHGIAEEQVKKSATEFATHKLERFTEVTEAAKARIAKLDTDYGDLYERIGETNAGLKLLQSNKETLEASLSSLTTESTKVRTSIEALKVSDLGRVAQIVSAIDSLVGEDSKALVKGVTEWKVQLDAMRTELSTKVSLNKKYRLRANTTGEFYACVNDGQGRIGSTLAICDATNHTNGTYWLVTEQ